MRLSKIKLAGFKSFVDPTIIPIPSNLVGVIGPNGCGKSNVIDAVRWVMGESSAKHLRGDSMADVIFNGSSARKPVGHASIELCFDNRDGALGGQYASYNEISIRRQVSRDGTSVYFLNGTRCRRRDITDIFLGTGLGPRSYAIIEQGTISRLIEAKPEELRVFLEEAAGISKYKERRRETENRIRHTRDNLSRLDDLLEEIEKQIDKLRRQARTAERFKELKQDERRIRAELLALRYQSQSGESESRQRAIQEQETSLEAVVAEQRALEAGLEKQRELLVEANDAFNQVQGRYYEQGAAVARIEQGIQHGKETRQRQRQELGRTEQSWNELQSHIEQDKARLQELTEELAHNQPAVGRARELAEASGKALQEAEQAMQDWQQDWDEFNRRAAEPAQTAQVERTRIDHLERQLEELTQRLVRNREEQNNLSSGDLEQQHSTLSVEERKAEESIGTAQAQLDEITTSISGSRESMQRFDSELVEARGRQQNLQGRLASLEALQQAALGQQSGVVTGWLESRGLADAPRLAQQIDVDAGWERAVETVLGFYLEAVCVEGLDDVASAIDGLEHGAVALFDTSGITTEGAPTSQLQALSSRVRAPWPLNDIIGGVFTADSLEEALALRSRLGETESVITPEGVWLGSRWLRVARDADERAGVLEREREIQGIRKQLDDYDSRIGEVSGLLEQARIDLEGAESRRGDQQMEVNQAHRSRSELRAQLSAVQARLEQVRSRTETVNREAGELRTQEARDREELSRARERLNTSLSEMETLADEREERIGRQGIIQDALQESRSKAQTDRESAHELAIKTEAMRTAHATTEQGLDRMRNQRDQLQKRREELQELLDKGDAPLARMEEELEQVLKSRLKVEQELSGARNKVEEIEHGIREHEQSRAGKEQQVLDIRGRLEQQRIDWQEIKVRCATLLEQINETGCELQNLLQEMPEEANVNDWSEQAEKLEKRISRLGPINLAAIEEYEEQSERKQYLDAQHSDLSEALATLESAISKIDRETRQRFRETFDKVNEGFKSGFPRLFGGGQAYLELTGDDLLDTGVTVMARPPGKRNSTIHLLSGGEKALTAVALVFSIFELNPAPFCMLDEVDAPLDDANVGRFCDMVREMSERVQFVFITHNKITMEMAHQLTGVTMNEPGVSRLVAVDVDEAVQMAAM